MAGRGEHDDMKETIPERVEPVFEVVDEAAVTPAMDCEWRGFLGECFEPGTPLLQSRYWHNSAPAYSVVCRVNGVLCGHVGMVVRSIRCGGTPVTIAGVQNLGVKPV